MPLPSEILSRLAEALKELVEGHRHVQIFRLDLIEPVDFFAPASLASGGHQVHARLLAAVVNPVADAGIRLDQPLSLQLAVGLGDGVAMHAQHLGQHPLGGAEFSPASLRRRRSPA